MKPPQPVSLLPDRHWRDAEFWLRCAEDAEGFNPSLVPQYRQNAARELNRAFEAHFTVRAILAIDLRTPRVVR